VFSLLSALKFFSLHLKNRFDILHNHGDSALVLLLLRCLLPIHIPIVTSVHIIRKTQDQIIRDHDPYKVAREALSNKITWSFPQPKSRKRELLFERIYLKLSDVLAVVSEGLKADIKNAYGIKRKVVVILNGVNTERFNNKINHLEESQRIREALGCKQLLLFVGVLNGRKGEFDLIRAMDKIVARMPDTKLLIIGDGPTKELAGQMTEKLGLSEHISFVPNVPYDDMPYYYKASDLFVLPSYSEGLPKVLLEAMACGTPVIASNIATHSYIIEDKVTGYLFDNGNVNALEAAIFTAIKNSAQRKIISSNAQTLIEKKYTWQNVSGTLNSVYNEVLNKRVIKAT
jgi:glycosyltransferase involved in cell wall biosynthesis